MVILEAFICPGSIDILLTYYLGPYIDINASAGLLSLTARYNLVLIH